MHVGKYSKASCLSFSWFLSEFPFLTIVGEEMLKEHSFWIINQETTPCWLLAAFSALSLLWCWHIEASVQVIWEYTWCFDVLKTSCLFYLCKNQKETKWNFTFRQVTCLVFWVVALKHSCFLLVLCIDFNGGSSFLSGCCPRGHTVHLLQPNHTQHNTTSKACFGSVCSHSLRYF